MVSQIVNNKAEAQDFIETYNPNHTPIQHLQHQVESIPRYPVNIAYCSDEKTGRRFGKTKSREGKSARKIGSGGRNKGSSRAYQLWIWEV